MRRKPHALSPRTMSERAYQRVRQYKTLNPHELLYYWANGIEIAGLKPDPAQQIYCAVAAANYYAPKLSNIEIKQDVRVKAVISAAPLTQHQWAQKYLNNANPAISYEVTPTQLVTQNTNSGEVTVEEATPPPTPVNAVLVPDNPAKQLENPSEPDAGVDFPEKNRK